MRYHKHLLSVTETLLQSGADGTSLLGKEEAVDPITVPVDFSDDRYLHTLLAAIDEMLCGTGAEAFRQLKLKKDVNLIEVSAGDECDSTEIIRI